MTEPIGRQPMTIDQLEAQRIAQEANVRPYYDKHSACLLASIKPLLILSGAVLAGSVLFALGNRLLGSRQ